MIDLSEIVLVNLIKHSGIEMWPYIITYLNFIESVFFGIWWHNMTVNKKTTTSTHSRNNLSVLGSGYAKMSLHSVADECTPSISATVMEGLHKRRVQYDYSSLKLVF